MASRLTKLVAAVSLVCGVTGAQAQLSLDNAFNAYQTYGDTNVYSMPYQALTYDAFFGGGTGPGNPYYVPSTPGAIKDLVVIYTGSDGAGVTTNVAGFDDAYGAPNGKKDDYATTSGINVSSVPADKPEIANSSQVTWDASLLAMKSFLAGGDAVFLFNNNDTNEDQNLAIWAKVWVTKGDGTMSGTYLYLSNMNQQYGFQPAPKFGPGTTTAWDHQAGSPLEPRVDDASGLTDYVQSGGTVCFNGALPPQPVACNDPSAVTTINHNLGANQVAYAGRIPVLDGYFDDLFKLSDGALGEYTFHMDLRLGCDPRWTDCANKKIDNGYEQLFLASTNTLVIDPHNGLPEPGTLLLIGLGMFGLAAARRRNQG